MATRPNPEFEIGPLFVRASVGPELEPVSIDVLWSLAVPPTRSALGLEQDLFLRPAALRGEGDRTSDDGRLEEYLRSRGFAVTGKGQLPLYVEDLYPPPDATGSDRRIGAAPFVLFRHVGLEALGVQPTATIVRIPWTPDLVNRVRLVKLRLLLDGAIRPRPASWAEELIRGKRHVLSLSFNDVRDPAIFPLYLENRARAIQLASEPSQLLARFSDPKRLRIDDIFPRTAAREPADGKASSEMVSVFLDASEGVVPQTLSVQFGYASGLQAWAPILIPLAFFVLGRATGPLIEHVSRGLGRRMSAHLRFGGSAGTTGRAEGALSPETRWPGSFPGGPRGRKCWRCAARKPSSSGSGSARPDMRPSCTGAARSCRSRERRLLWLLSSVSEWELEEQEVEVWLEGGVVADVQVRVRRARLPHPDTV